MEKEKLEILKEALEDDNYSSDFMWEEGYIDELQHKIERLENAILRVLNQDFN